jgi:hypothetical protein
MDENELKDLQKTIAGAIKDGIRDGMAATARAQKDAKAGKTTSSYSASSSGVSSSASEKLTGSPFKASLGQTEQAIQNAGGTVRDFAQNAASAAPFVAMFGDELGSVIGYFEETNDTFKGLSKVGAGLEGRLGELRMSAAETRMTLGDFANMVGNNSELLAGFAGGVTGGIKRFRQLSSAMMEGDTIAGFQNLGYSLQESNEFILKNLEFQRRDAKFRDKDGNLNQELMLQSSLQMAESLDVMAKVAGKDLKRMNDELVERQRSGATQAKLRLLEQQGIKGAGESYRTAQTALQGAPKAARDLVDDLLQTGVPMSESTKAFMATNKDAERLGRQMADAIKNGEKDKAKQLGEQLTAASIAFSNSTEGLTLATYAKVNPIAQMVAGNLEEVGGIIDQVSEHAKKIGEPLTDTASYVRTFNDIILETTSISKTQKAGMTTGQEMSTAINEVQLALANGATKINKNIGEAMGPDSKFVSLLEKGATALTGAIGTFVGALDPNFFNGQLNPEITDEVPTNLNNLPTNPRGKALGGGVLQDVAYKIGELGPETFVPSMDGAIIPNMKSMLNRMPDMAQQLQDQMATMGAPMTEAAKTAMATMPQGGSVEEKLDILNQTMLQLVNINTMHKDIGNKQIRTMRSAGNLMSGLGRA